MVKLILKLLAIFGGWTLAFMVLKLVFILFHGPILKAGCGDAFAILWHGLPMDMSVAGYLSVVPFLLTILSVWFAGRWVDVVANVWFVITAFVSGLIFSLDMGLYGVWGFRMDMTPVFYFTSSPEAAMAGMTLWQWIGGAFGLLLFGGGIWWWMYRVIWRRLRPDRTRRVLSTVGGILACGVLVIPIRGGVTVSTMNPGYVYFSPDQNFNQAALNPAFNLLYSATHQGNFDRQFRFMDEAEAERILRGYEPEGFSTEIHSRVSKPDVWLIILESFSANLLPSLGGEKVAPRLDSIAGTGVEFGECYASSFRTDRALPAVLSGFPAQPTTSIMKFIEKTRDLPSIANTLKGDGYHTTYFYGGDVNFTNMNAYLVNTGFQRIVSDKDFPIGKRLSKWGVYDHDLFQRALEETRGGSAAPQFRVVQTSSSHEPFEVPYSDPAWAGKPRRNAFAYTDKALGDFVNALRMRGDWGKTLVVITADHQGGWPEELEPRQKHHIPFIITGGALTGAPARIDNTVSQTDIAATVLELAGSDPGKLAFSRSALSTKPKYAFFSQPHLAGVATPQGVFTIDTDTGKPITPSTPPAIEALIKAYLQELYRHLDRL